jgi:hypothetical protein
MKLPVANKDFGELTFVGKATYIAGVVSAVAGAILGTWQLSAYASTEAETYIKDRIAETAPAIVEAQLVSYDEEHQTTLKQFQQQQQVFYYGNQIQILRLELRSIDAEISSITRGKAPEDMTPADQARLDVLRDDRQYIRDEMTRYTQQQQQVQQQRSPVN